MNAQETDELVLDKDLVNQKLKSSAKIGSWCIIWKTRASNKPGQGGTYSVKYHLEPVQSIDIDTFFWTKAAYLYS